MIWVNSCAIHSFHPIAALSNMPTPMPPTRKAGLKPAVAAASLSSWPRFMPLPAATFRAARAPAGVPAAMPTIIPGAAAPGSLKQARMGRSSSTS